MRTKMLTPVLALVMVLALVVMAGCGTEKPKVTADKTAIALTEIILSGSATNEADAGLNKGDADAAYQEIASSLDAAFAKFEISDESAQELTDYYLDTVGNNLNITATVKEDSDTPTVEIKFTPHDVKTFETELTNDPEIGEMVAALAILKQSNVDPKTVPEYNQGAVRVLKRVIDAMPLKSEQTVTAKFKIGKNDKGELAWTPDDMNKFKTEITNSQM